MAGVVVAVTSSTWLVHHPTDRLLIYDVDDSEQDHIQAYVKNGASYSPVSVSAWTVIPYTGVMGVQPDSRWPTWNATAGTFTSNDPEANSRSTC